ncbi:acyl-CoA dehydrogenase family protein [Amycolatopsis vastitatis]|uniref:Acyl-CoA dehydrogenase n=1 Tax=Amycolatopsis vastitatis TaxID=1905142 RepID=A0A229TEA1_9PSEU|nr:acyl-CoA dehydrogenase family protein [Amycolatopsis vastitatis]OXM69566.1 acyl-CoA dehydrogenase [Amycolatopsis vastitatis]
METLADALAAVTAAAGTDASAWDRAGRIPEALVRELSRGGLLCAQVPAEYGGPGFSSRDNGELTAHTGSLCGSLRSLQTSQGMAAWTVQRLGRPAQREEFLPKLAGGALAAVAMSEPAAGSDLSGMRTGIRSDGDTVVVDGAKIWVTGAAYADLLVVFGTYERGTGVAVVPGGTPGVTVEPVGNPLGCRAAGHADVRFENVRLPASHLLAASGAPLPMLVTTALSYGRLSVAWGCAGLVRACRIAAVRHASGRVQFGEPLAGHQLVARHLAELVTAEHLATLACAHASTRWDEGSPDQAVAAVLAKQIAARQAADGAARAVQVLASAGAHDDHVVARAYRDAKLMEIIEGSTEICQLLLAEHALAALR